MSNAIGLTSMLLSAVQADGVQPLPTAAQQKFKQLTDHIQQQQHALQQWQETALAVQQKIIGQLMPLYDALAGHQIQLIQQLEVVLSTIKLPPRQQTQLVDVILMLSDRVVERCMSEAQAIWLAQLREQYQPSAVVVVSAVTDEPTRMEQLRTEIRQAVDDAYGVDVAEASEDELYFWSQQLEADFGAGRSRKKKKPSGQKALTSTQYADEQSEVIKQQNKILANKSLKLIYQRLAARLHPDREMDAEKKVRKTALLQTVIQAYQQKDVVTLLNFQHEFTSPNDPQRAGASDEQLGLYIINLEKHSQQLDAELVQIKQQLANDINSAVLLQPKQAMQWITQHIKQTQDWIWHIQYAQTHLNNKHQVQAFLQQFDPYE